MGTRLMGINKLRLKEVKKETKESKCKFSVRR